MILYFLKYNNYYNRILKKKSSIADYQLLPGYKGLTNTLNFNPNDGVTTKQVINSDLIASSDYIVCGDSNGNIVSRWFIIEAVFKLKGQYECLLRRDVVADYWDFIKEAPMYIDKCTLSDGSPFIFNKENITVNQIKQDEIPLKDSTDSGWLVGYIKRDYPGGTITIDANVIADYSYSSTADFETAIGLNHSVKYKLVPPTGGKQLVIYLFRTRTNPSIPGDYHKIVLNLTYGTFSDTVLSSSLANNYITVAEVNYNNFINSLRNNINLTTALTYETQPITDLATYNDGKWSVCSGLYEKKLKVNGSYFNLQVTYEPSYIEYSAANTQFYTYIKSLIINQMGAETGCGIFAARDTNACYFEYNPIAYGTYTITMPSEANRLHVLDAPYDMFAIPLEGHWKGINTTDLPLCSFDKQTSISFAQGIADKVTSSYLIDLQVVPFCPFTSYSHDVSSIVLDTSNSKTFTKILDSGSITKAFVVWCTSSQNSFTIRKSFTVDNLKMNSECNLYRLCSPNYAAIYDFNIAKLKTNNVDFKIDYTYLPYSPFIHIQPIFSGMYGNYNNDARGLICQGDFSISYTSDKWAEYQISNKYYSEIFDRQIKHMDVSQEISQWKNVIGGLGATAGGTVAGAVKGGVGGAIAGGVAAAAGSVSNIIFSQTSYNESKSFAVDNYNLNLATIQAQPDTLTKVTAYNICNKIFPLIEIYSCTDEEKTAVANKIKFTGMTAGYVGYLNNVLGNSWSYNGISDSGFISGRIIRLESISEDFHLASEIAKEIAQGIFTKE